MSPGSSFEDALCQLGSAGWRLYYARWERRAVMRFSGLPWTVRAKIEPIRGGRGVRAYASMDFVRPSWDAARIKALVRDPHFLPLASRLQQKGYTPLLERLERSAHLHRRLPATARSMHRQRALLDELLGEGERDPCAEGHGFAAAIREFRGSRRWLPAGAGWSMPERIVLQGGGTVTCGILLVQRDDGTLVGGRDLHVVTSIMVMPKGRNGSAQIRRVSPFIKAAGYVGGPQCARSTKTGRPSWLFGDFGRRLRTVTGITAEVRRLNSLMEVLRAA